MNFVCLFMKTFNVKLNNKSKLVQKEQLGRRNMAFNSIFTLKYSSGG